MGIVRWYEVDRARVVLEHVRMRQYYPHFTAVVRDGQLGWEGELHESPPGVTAPPLHVRLLYPPAYPVRPPRIMPLAPELPAEHWGHAWHRWREGYLRIVEPRHWTLAYTACDALSKAADWYFNYLAKVNGLVDEMPDIGRVVLDQPSEPY